MTLLTYATRRLVDLNAGVPLVAVFATLLLVAILFAQELIRAYQGEVAAGRSRLRILHAILVPQLLVFVILVATRVDIAVR